MSARPRLGSRASLVGRTNCTCNRSNPRDAVGGERRPEICRPWTVGPVLDPALGLTTPRNFLGAEEGPIGLGSSVAVVCSPSIGTCCACYSHPPTFEIQCQHPSPAGWSPCFTDERYTLAQVARRSLADWFSSNIDGGDGAAGHPRWVPGLLARLGTETRALESTMEPMTAEPESSNPAKGTTGESAKP